MMSMTLDEIKKTLSTPPAEYNKQLAKELINHQPSEAVPYFLAVTKLHLQWLQQQTIVPSEINPINHECECFIGYFETAYRLHGLSDNSLDLQGFQFFYDRANQQKNTFFTLFTGKKTWTSESLYNQKFASFFKKEMLKDTFARPYLAEIISKKIEEKEKTLAERMKTLDEVSLLDDEEALTELTRRIAPRVERLTEKSKQFREKQANWLEQRSAEKALRRQGEASNSSTSIEEPSSLFRI